MARLKLIGLLGLAIFVANVTVYYVTEVNTQQRIAIALEDNIKNLQTHVEGLLYEQKSTADAMYQTTIRTEKVMQILEKASRASSKDRVVLREQLYALLEGKYEIFKIKDVLQYQFVFTNNHSFLRMHKPSKFGDDLSKIREDFRYVNEHKKPIRGFVQGRTVHGFRNTYPIFSKSGKHISTMEVSFSSDGFQEYLNTISKIHTHFLVNKHIFDTKTWARDDLVLQYVQSSEHEDYMLSMNRMHTHEKCIVQNKQKLKNIRHEIHEGIKKGEIFAVYAKHHERVDVVSFLPIKNLKEDTTLAWFVSYVENKFIEKTLKGSFMIRIFFMVLFFILGYLLYRYIRIKKHIEEEIHKKAYIDGLTGVYNRNKFDELMAQELKREARHHHSLSVAIVDIDHFKIFNDRYGHLVGDEVLILLAQYLKNQVRSTDTFARWGGEEFVLLFPETSKENMQKVCDKLRKGIETLNHPVAGGITASFGVTQYAEGDTHERMFKRCDDALYEAKESGRNKVCMK